jgi:hypothetical protein
VPSNGHQADPTKKRKGKERTEEVRGANVRHGHNGSLKHKKIRKNERYRIFLVKKNSDGAGREEGRGREWK